MRENLKIAEQERKFLLSQQKKLLGTSSNTENSDDKGSENVSIDVANAEVLKGLQKFEKSQKFLTSKERKLARRSSGESSRNQSPVSSTIISDKGTKSQTEGIPEES